ncbi:hypothetical protein K5X82_07210 [Halosquirtibacter xylanolyticus]|uniref:glycosyl hydrolase family 95 catalytic domain-containing protein n=1 Tax=Halosquirtibacter xylanolyticus TaxID=3374599 RepID=UPI003748F594|nr:hypothetical protein K5X82_07210 [Prolixibacteraceae bacterium]
MSSIDRFLSVLCFIFWTVFHMNASAQDASERWIIKTNEVSQAYAGATLSNGCIGVVPKRELFLTKEVVLGGVYDLKKGKETTGLLSGVNPLNLRMAIDDVMLEMANVSNWEQSLDMRRAILNSSFDYSKKAKISYDLITPRNLPYVSMIKVQVTALKEFTLDVRSMVRWSDRCWQKPSMNSRVLIDEETHISLHQCEASSITGDTKSFTTTGFIFPTNKPSEVTTKDFPYHPNLYGFKRVLKKGQTYTFTLVSSFCTDQHFVDAKSESERFVIYSMLNGTDRIIDDHCRAWEKLWKHDIQIKGDINDQLDVRLALYHLYSFVREGNDWSIPPMGLSSSDGYDGHIFWDAEIWMYPVLLVMNPPLAKSMINFRIDKVDAAERRAHNYGYAGVMYPWETNDSGEEMTPTWALTGTFEHHITGDIGWAIWNYYRVTQDKEWLRDRGYPVLRKVADFWVSRAHENRDHSYSILNVVGADEYAPNVDDNAFTNGIAKYVLNAATQAAKILELPEDKEWNRIADNLAFHFFDDGVMKEHREYSGEIIKQADVNLLSFPLGIVQNKREMLQNVKYYEKRVAKEGPAMTHAIYSIIYAKLGHEKEAYRLFKKAYVNNKKAPFGVLSETVDRDNPYFVTAAGGLLQSVLFGFYGLEITDTGIQQTSSPIVPKQWKELHVTY